MSRMSQYDRDLETAIRNWSDRTVGGKTREERREAAQRVRELVKQRRPEQVARMEKSRGLTR